MIKSSHVFGLCLAGAALAMATFSSDASAYTRTVCGIAGVVDSLSGWTRHNCALTNNTGGFAYVKFPVPTDSGYDINGYAILQGSATATGTAQLLTFDQTAYWDYTDQIATVGSSTLVQGIVLPSTDMVGTEGTATIVVGLQQGNSVYDVGIEQ